MIKYLINLSGVIGQKNLWITECRRSFNYMGEIILKHLCGEKKAISNLRIAPAKGLDAGGNVLDFFNQPKTAPQECIWVIDDLLIKID